MCSLLVGVVEHDAVYTAEHVLKVKVEVRIGL
jgi:hypothetical protein